MGHLLKGLAHVIAVSESVLEQRVGDDGAVKARPSVALYTRRKRREREGGDQHQHEKALHLLLPPLFDLHTIPERENVEGDFNLPHSLNFPHFPPIAG
jgi:hypothetical protein